MKSILLYIDQGATLEARVQAALDIARAFDGHITCLQATPLDVFVMGDPLVGMYLSADGLAAMREAEDKQQAALEARLVAEGVKWNWVRSEAAPAQAIISRSRLADIIVLGLPGKTAPDGNLSLISHVAVHARAPILAVPESARGFDCQGTAIVAWNGSMESAHATRFAVPLLAKAADVKLVGVSDDDTAFPATDGAEYLAQQGIRSEPCSWPRRGRLVSEALLDAATTMGGAYLVAGAYGHTRFREAILGGASRELIQNSPLPLLLAH